MSGDPWGRTREEALADARKRLAGLEARWAAASDPPASMARTMTALCVAAWRGIVARLAQEPLDFDA